MGEFITDMIRASWDAKKERKKHPWKTTIVICERDTIEVTRLCLESILRFYPDIPILVVDGGSTDGTLLYLKSLRVRFSNVEAWIRGGRNGHGTMLDEAIRRYVKTDYVLMMDSDTIVMRKFIKAWEIILGFGNENLYGIGSLMLVTRQNEGCGSPLGENDILRYLHPSCSLFRRSMYLTLRPFIEHGAPCWANFADAQDRGLIVVGANVEDYVLHLSGASWCNPNPIWGSDNDVNVRPFFTILFDPSVQVNGINSQYDRDFDMLPIPKETVHENIVIHNVGYFNPRDPRFLLRHRIKGEYVVDISGNQNINPNTLYNAKVYLTDNAFPERAVIDGFEFVARQIWQTKDGLK